MRFERWHLAGRSGFHPFRRRSKASGASPRGRPRCRSTVIGINLLSVELAYLLSQGGIGETPGLWYSGYLKKAPEAGDGSPFGRFAFRTLHQSCLMSMTCALRFTNSRRLSFLMWAPSGRGRPQWLDVFTDSASLTQPVVPLPPPLSCVRCAVGRSRACCGRGERRRARLHGTRP